MKFKVKALITQHVETEIHADDQLEADRKAFALRPGDFKDGIILNHVGVSEVTEIPKS